MITYSESLREGYYAWVTQVHNKIVDLWEELKENGVEEFEYESSIYTPIGVKDFLNSHIKPYIKIDDVSYVWNNSPGLLIYMVKTLEDKLNEVRNIRKGEDITK